MRGRSAISTTADAAPRDATSASARSTTSASEPSPPIAQDVSAARRGERRHVVTVRRDEHPVERARAEHVEHVLEEPPSEAGALVVVEHGAKARLAAAASDLAGTMAQAGRFIAATSAANASTSRARRRRSSRERMIVEVPSTGMLDATVASSPRSTTIARTSPR